MISLRSAKDGAGSAGSVSTRLGVYWSRSAFVAASLPEIRLVELASLSRAANHFKTAKLEWEQAAAHKETAGVALWLIEHRDELLQQTSRTLEVRPVEEFPRLIEVSGPVKGIDALLGQKSTEK